MTTTHTTHQHIHHTESCLYDERIFVLKPKFLILPKKIAGKQYFSFPVCSVFMVSIPLPSSCTPRLSSSSVLHQDCTHTNACAREREGLRTAPGMLEDELPFLPSPALGTGLFQTLQMKETRTDEYKSPVFFILFQKLFADPAHSSPFGCALVAVDLGLKWQSRR